MNMLLDREKASRYLPEKGTIKGGLDSTCGVNHLDVVIPGPDLRSLIDLCNECAASCIERTPIWGFNVEIALHTRQKWLGKSAQLG